jgi:two-component system, NtrC family, sensor kinase
VSIITDIRHIVTLDTQLIGAITICLVLTALAVFVMLHPPRAALNLRFGAMTLTAAGWMITISVALAAKNPYHTAILGRLGFAFASAIPFFLFWMVDALSEFRSNRLTSVILPGASCVGFALLSCSNLIVAGATSALPRANFVYGPAYPYFGVYFLLSFASGLYTLLRTINSTTGLRRLQLRYLLLSISLTGAGAVTTNLLIPLLFGTSKYSALAPYFSLLFFSFFAHAIIRYRLMDIRVVIRQSVVYVGAILVSASLFLALAELLRRLAGYDKNSVPLAQALVVAIALALFFQPLKNWIELSFNRYLYRHAYDYQRTVREASRRLSTMLELDPLLDYLTDAIETTFKVETVAVYLLDPDTKTLIAKPRTVSGHWPYSSSAPTITEASSLVAFLRRDQGPLVREDVTLDEQRMTAARELQQLEAEIALPLLSDNIIVGAIVIGSKRSGDPYFAEDIDLLTTLVSQAAVAMKNAQLYRQVVMVNEYVDNILSTMESGVVAVNSAGEISLFNAAAERLTGFDLSRVRGHSYDCLPAALASPLRETLDAQIARAEFETALQNPSGSNVPLVCSTAILKYKDSVTHGALIVFSDVTRIKELERENRRAERLASFGALASGVAHEIKNPLVAIRTFAELLPERYSDTDFREDFSKVVIREIARIDALVDRLRGIAAIAPPQVGTVDIRDPIRDTIALLRAQLEQTRTVVSCDFQDSAPFVAVEEAQLKQLFLNLLLNSIEAMGPGGEVTVRVSCRDLRGSQWTVTEVSDTGPGIPELLRSTIFDPFFTTKARGSGLGLAICRGIIDAHRGTIRAENRLDRSGTKIVVEFPATIQTPTLEEERAFS